MGSLFLLQGIFPTQGSNPGLLHGRQTLYHLSHKGRLTCAQTSALPPQPSPPGLTRVLRFSLLILHENMWAGQCHSLKNWSSSQAWLRALGCVCVRAKSLQPCLGFILDNSSHSVELMVHQIIIIKYGDLLKKT